VPPVPKRSDQRRRRNVEGRPDKVTAQGAVPVPDPGEDWHPVARDWYLSLGESGQSVYFEPSDWQHARFICEALTRNLNAGKFSAQLFASVEGAMNNLGSTEGARRRLRIEVERALGDLPVDAEVASIEKYRKALGA
jgi:hypothetical protein